MVYTLVKERVLVAVILAISLQFKNRDISSQVKKGDISALISIGNRGIMVTKKIQTRNPRASTTCNPTANTPPLSPPRGTKYVRTIMSTMHLQ